MVNTDASIAAILLIVTGENPFFRFPCPISLLKKNAVALFFFLFLPPRVFTEPPFLPRFVVDFHLLAALLGDDGNFSNTFNLVDLVGMFYSSFLIYLFSLTEFTLEVCFTI